MLLGENMYSSIVQAYAHNPGFTSIMNTFQVETDIQNEIIELAEQQYISLERLGYDIIEDNPMPDSFFQDIISYTHSNYLYIRDIDTIMNSGRELQLFGKLTYMCVCVDMIKFIIPKTMATLGAQTSEFLLTFEPIKLRETLIQTCLDRIKLISMFKDISSNTPLTYEQVKYSYYAELFDTDIEKFISHYLDVVCFEYSHTMNPTNWR